MTRALATAQLSTVLTLGLLLTACPEPEPEPAPDGGGTIVARDAGQFPENDGGRPEVDAGAPGPCPEDDAHEDNDTRADATPLSGETQGVLCGDDDDYYAATAQPGCLVSARLQFDPSSGDMDLMLYGPDGFLLDADTGVGAEAVVASSANAAGDYAVRVTGDPGVAADYRVRLVVTCQADLMCPADDAYEDNDTATESTALGDGELAVGIVCGADDDYYSLAAPLGCAVQAQLTYAHATGKDLDLHVFLPDGSEGQRSLSVNGTERTTTLVEPGGQPVVQVHGFGGSFVDNTYRLELNRVCASDLSCSTPDPGEPNDTAQDAFVIYPGAGALGQICPGEEDWFRFSAKTGCTYDVLLDFDHEAGNLDLSAQKADGTVLGTSVSADDDEQLQFVADATGSVRVRVFALSASVTNTFRVSVAESGCP